MRENNRRILMIACIFLNFEIIILEKECYYNIFILYVKILIGDGV